MDQPHMLKPGEAGPLPKYRPPELVTYTEQELLEKIGPARAGTGDTDSINPDASLVPENAYEFGRGSIAPDVYWPHENAFEFGRDSTDPDAPEPKDPFEWP